MDSIFTTSKKQSNISKIIKKITISLIILFFGFSINAQTFSNTTVAACNTWDSGNLYTGFTRVIAVAALPSPLGTGIGQVVLKQINLKLGNPSCIGTLSSYNVRLVSPAGTIIQIFQPFTSTATSQWMDIKIRDNAALERVNDYSATIKQNYWPWSIGYYRTNAVDAFSTVNGENPNGNWTLQIQENTGSEISFEKVELIFGTNTVTDISGSSTNNDCGGSQCIDTKSVFVGTNNGYSASDPRYPGNTVSSCSWNGANNNSAWYHFTANSTTAYITLSGIINATPGSSDTQPIILESSGTDCSAGTLTVPTGGCPDDQTVNNMAYISPNGGSTLSNVYVNGIGANAEFNLSGLTIGKKYYLYIDGNGGLSSSFYIELSGGGQDCSTPLPIELISFEATSQKNSNVITWATSSETNNDYFIIEKSKNGLDFEFLDNIKASNKKTGDSYQSSDYQPYKQTYYRLKQIDFNNSFSYSNIIFVNIDQTNTPNFYLSDNHLNVNGLEKSNDVKISIFDGIGKLIYAQNNKQSIDMQDFPSSVYLIKTEFDGNVIYQKIIK